MIALGLVLALVQATPPPPAPTVADYPFAVGERLEYSAKLGILTLGSGTLEVAALDTLRGAESFRLRFRLQGKAVFYSLDDVMEAAQPSEVDLNGARYLGRRVAETAAKLSG